MKTKIKVIGVGGSGGNAVSRMRKFKIEGVELVAINTDAQDLGKISADVKLRIGKKLTQGLGTGMNPNIGQKAALESKEEISEILRGADLVFITCGLGGGTGSGASPVVAEMAKSLGALTVAVVTRPFSFEGAYRKKIAQTSERLLREKVDSLIAIENDRLLEILDQKTTVLNAFWFCDDILREAVRGISDLIALPGIINVNFSDIKSILKDSGTALFGMGMGRGENRTEEAMKAALSSSLLNISPKGAKGILFNVSGRDVSLAEIEEIGRTVAKEISSGAKVIFGARKDEKLKEGEIKVTVIATGF
jgi:cell division protein FtsZ